MKCIENLKKYCITNGIISESDVDWFQYGIERRLVTIFVGCPFFMLALIMTNVSTSVAFFLSFYYLRCRTNGFHAKSVFGCLIISLLCEIYFLTIFYYLLTPIIMFCINIACILLVFLLAPFKDSSFRLTSKELYAIKRSAKIRIFVLTATACILSMLGMHESAKGITTGIAMAVFLLGLAYIMNGGKPYEQTAEKGQESCEQTGIQDD